MIPFYTPAAVIPSSSGNGGMIFLGVVILGILAAVGSCSGDKSPALTEYGKEVQAEAKKPFKLPNPEEMLWVNPAEAGKFIGGDMRSMVAFEEKDASHTFLTRVDLVVFSIQTNGNQRIITRRP